MRQNRMNRMRDYQARAVMDKETEKERDLALRDRLVEELHCVTQVGKNCVPSRISFLQYVSERTQECPNRHSRTKNEPSPTLWTNSRPIE